MIIRTFPVSPWDLPALARKYLVQDHFASKLKLHNCLSTDSSEKPHEVCHLTVVGPFFVAVSCVPSTLSHKPAKMWGNYLAIMILVAGPNPSRGIWMLVSLSSMQAVVHSKNKAVKGQVGVPRRSNSVQGIPHLQPDVSLAVECMYLKQPSPIPSVK